MVHFRTLKAKFLSPTNHRGARVKITDEYFGDAMTLDYNYKYGSLIKQVEAFLKDNKFNLIGYSECKKDYVFIIDNWGDDAIRLCDLPSFPF